MNKRSIYENEPFKIVKLTNENIDLFALKHEKSTICAGKSEVKYSYSCKRRKKLFHPNDLVLK